MISGDDACCSVMFGTLFFSGMWSELLMTSAISCLLWSSVYECHRVECAFTSPVRTECSMFVMYYMQCCMFVMYCMQCCMSVLAVLLLFLLFATTISVVELVKVPVVGVAKRTN